MGPELVAAAAIGGLGLDAGSKIYKGYGDQASQEFMARRDERAAELGRLRASQTDAQLREELNTTLANIDAVRAAGNIDPTSPTTAALKDRESFVSDRARNIKVASLRAQADEDEATSRYRREVGRSAVVGGWLGGLGSGLRGIGMMRGLGSLGSLGNSSIGDPTRLGSLY